MFAKLESCLARLIRSRPSPSSFHQPRVRDAEGVGISAPCLGIKMALCRFVGAVQSRLPAEPNGGIASRLEAGGFPGRVQAIGAVRISPVRLFHLRNGSAATAVGPNPYSFLKDWIADRKQLLEPGGIISWARDDAL